jgi:hypothetical protein
MFREIVIIYREELLGTRPSPSRRTTPYRLSAIVYSPYIAERPKLPAVPPPTPSLLAMP